MNFNISSNGAQAPDQGGLAKVAYDGIMQMVLSRQLVAGEIVQERPLSVILDMSRTPIREALRRMEAEGWMVRLNDRTIAVKLVGIEEYTSALKVREILEPEAAALAAKKADKNAIRRWRNQLEKLTETDGTIAKLQWEFDQSLHVGIAIASQNVVLPKIINELHKTTQMFENQTLPAKSFPGYKDHIAIIVAIEANDSEGARKAMQDHLRQVKKNVMEQL
jgi:DNA-binding GntR family transcriptional regulator